MGILGILWAYYGCYGLGLLGMVSWYIVWLKFSGYTGKLGIFWICLGIDVL
ncbi:hypothetical protein METBIDRAFT_32589, partial [Metschnikowia bicuspidata var. bicuspidata NRRL YB-4993]